MHLVDQGREFIETHKVRPFFDRVVRELLAQILPHPFRFRVAALLARLAEPVKGGLPKPFRAMVEVVPKVPKSSVKADRAERSPRRQSHRQRVALSKGCVQQVVGAHINRAAERMLDRVGCEVVTADGQVCCGALTHHLGKTQDALKYISANVTTWSAEIDGKGLDAIVTTASGCGTMIKEYGYLLSGKLGLESAAGQVSHIARDITEVIADQGLPHIDKPRALRVAYQDACSLAHGQQIREQPRELLTAAGYVVVEIPEGHLCCGSAGTYNVLQPELAGRLGVRKIENIDSVDPDVIAVGNIGCINQISAHTRIPVVHTIELLDWATGGPRPPALRAG